MINLAPVVVLVSGHSASVLAIANTKDFANHALPFACGHRHGCDREAARRVVAPGSATEHGVLIVDVRTFSASNWTSDIPTPKRRRLADISAGSPIAYVAARNTI